MQAVDEQQELIIKMSVFFVLDKYSDAKTSSDAQCLLGTICTFNFIFSLCVLKFILSNTNALCMHFQGKLLDARKKADITISTLKSAEMNLILPTFGKWQNKKDEQENEEIQFKEPCLPRGGTSDLESSYRVNFFYMSLDHVTWV